MANLISKCPSCNGDLYISSLTCPDCGMELRGQFDWEPGPLDRLTKEQQDFMLSFLRCRGNMSQLQTELRISYPTAKKKLDDLLTGLGLIEKKEGEIDMSIFRKAPTATSSKASDIIQNKLYENKGRAMVRSVSGKSYEIRIGADGKTLLCDALPVTPPYELAVFDVIVELLLRKGGRARKGNGRNYRLGEGDCTVDTVVGAIGKEYSGKSEGQSVFDPVFVLSAVLEWAGIARNERGWLSLTAEYLAKRGEA